VVRRTPSPKAISKKGLSSRNPRDPVCCPRSASDAATTQVSQTCQQAGVNQSSGIATPLQQGENGSAEHGEAGRIGKAGTVFNARHRPNRSNRHIGRHTGDQAQQGRMLENGSNIP